MRIAEGGVWLGGVVWGGLLASSVVAQPIFTRLAYTGEESGVGSRVFLNAFSPPRISGNFVTFYAGLTRTPGALDASVSEGANFRGSITGGRLPFIVDASFAVAAGDNIYSLNGNAGEPNTNGSLIIALPLNGNEMPPSQPETFSALYTGTQTTGPVKLFVGGENTPASSGLTTQFERKRSFQGPAAFFEEDVNDAGQVIFGSWLEFNEMMSTVPPVDRVAYFAGPTTDLRLIFKGGDPAPGVANGTFVSMNQLTSRINELGQVIFDANFNTPTNGGESGIFAGPYTAPTLRFRPGDNVGGFPLNDWHQPYLNNDGKLCMLATIQVDLVLQGAIVFGPLATPAIVLKTSDPAPDNPNEFIGALELLTCNDEDELAFLVTRFDIEVEDEFGNTFLDPTNTPDTLYAGTPGNFRVVARAGDALPGTWSDSPTIFNFRSVYINNQGRILTLVTVQGSDFELDDALVWYERNGTATTIVRAGEPFQASAGNTRVIAPNIIIDGLYGALDRNAPMNQNGDVIFSLSFFDPTPPGLVNSSGIYVASPPGPPAQPPVLQSVRSRKVHAP